MPGKNPGEAVREFIGPLQRTASCLTRDVLMVSSRGRNTTDTIHALTLSGGPIELSCGRVDGFKLSVGLQYDVIKTADPEKGPYKVRARAYDYALHAPDGDTQMSFHWHPLGSSTYHDPHFHIPQQWRGIHFPGQRISMEEVVRLCIRELGAEPIRDDWENVLLLNETVFTLYRSWSHQVQLAEPAAARPIPKHAGRAR